jgi:hypothetical protein
MVTPNWLGEREYQLISDARMSVFPNATATLVYGSFLDSAGVAYTDIDLLCVLPAGGPVLKRQIVLKGQKFDMAGIPTDALDKLPELSFRMRLPVGLFGLASGQLIDGVLPDRELIRLKCQNAINELNRRLAPKTAKLGQEGMDLALAASSATGAEKTAMALVAVSKLLHAELNIRSNNHIASQSGLRRAAQRYPDVVENYLSITAALANNDFKPLLAKTIAFSKPAKKPSLQSYEIDPAKFGL